MNRVSAAIATVLCAAAIVGCGSSGSGSQGGSAAATGSPLALALSYAPKGAAASYEFDFADFGAIEADFGYRPTELASHAKLQAFSVRLADQTDGPVAGGNVSFDLGSSVGQVWSVADTAWDASVFPPGGGPSLNMIGFVPTFPIASVESHLAKCGFKSASQHGFTVYSASTAVALKCAGPFGTAMPPLASTFAFDASDHLALFSPSASAVSAAIAGHSSASRPAAATALLAALPAQAVHLAVGPAACTAMSSPGHFAGRNATPATIATAERLYTDATPYTGFGFGYSFPHGELGARIAFTYSSAATAKSDLTRREQILRTGLSLQTSLPYSKLIALTSGRVAGRTVELDVTHPAGRPLHLYYMYVQHDLGFARC